MTAADRITVAAIGFMFVVIPLYGTFQVFDPLRTPNPTLVDLKGATAIACVLLLAAALCVWGALRRRTIPRRIVIAQLLAGGAIVPSALLGFDPVRGLEIALMVLAMGGVGCAIYAYAPLPGALRAIVIAFLVSAAAFTLLALAMDWSRAPAPLFAYNNGRAVGTFLNPNELAAYLLVVLSLALGVAWNVHDGGLRGLGIVTALIAAVGLGATYSRWGFIAAAAGLACFALLRGGRRAWAGVAVAVALALAVAIGPGAAHHNPRDDTSRLVAWTTGVRTWLAFPLTGTGPFAFRRTYDVLRPPEAPGGETPVAFDPHSLPLAYLDESGVLGFGTALFIWGTYLRETRRALRTAGPHRQAIAYAVVAGLAALNVHVLVNTISIYFVFITQGAGLALALAMNDLDAPAA